MDLLYQGSLPRSANHVVRGGFDLLVLCAREHPPSVSASRELPIIVCPLDDDHVLPERQWRRAAACAREVALAVDRGFRVLVTCAQGRNRSGLVSGIALHLLTGHNGCDCAKYIQRRRPGALSNEAFVAALCKRLA